MVTVTIVDGRVHLEVERLDKLWALRSHLELPLAHVKSVRIDVDAARGWWHGLRLGGTNVPGLLTAGTFYSHSDGLVFYDVHDPSRTIVLELEHEHYRRLVVEVEDPAAALQQFRDAGTTVTS
jgi:predicted nucleic acid-binding protein